MKNFAVILTAAIFGLLLTGCSTSSYTYTDSEVPTYGSTAPAAPQVEAPVDTGSYTAPAGDSASRSGSGSGYATTGSSTSGRNYQFLWEEEPSTWYNRSPDQQ